MIKIKQLISYILVIQLFVSCTGSGGSSSVVSNSSNSGGTGGGTSGGDASGGGGTVTIEGQISQVFRGVSEFLIPSAVAEEGEITVIDITDPSDPKPIGKPFPVESEAKGYSIELPADQVVGTILKLQYKGLVGERDLLITIDDVGSIEGEMNEEKHFEAGILEEQLKQEVGNFGEKKEFRERFKKLKESGVGEDLALFGDSESMKQILKDVETAPDMKGLIIRARQARENEEFEKESELVSEMVGIAKKLFGESYSSKNHLNCVESRAKFFIDGKKQYNFTLIGNDLEVLRAFGGVADFGIASTSEEANRILRDMTLKLQGISKENKDKNVSGVVTVTDVSGGEEIDSDKTCTLKAFKGEIEDPDYFYNLKFIQDFQFADAANQDEFSQKLIEAFEKSFEEYAINLPMKIGEDEKMLTFVINQERGKAKELIEKRSKDYVESISGAFNPSLMRDIDFEKLSTYDEGSRALEAAFKKTIEDLDAKTALVEASKATDLTTEEQAAQMKKAFVDVKRTMTEDASADDSLTQEELAREYFLSRLDDLRKYFSDKYKADYAYNTELINSIDLEKLSLDKKGVQRLMEGMKLSIHDVQTKIDQKGGVESLAASEILFFQIRDISSQLESRLVEFQDILHPGGSSYVMERSRISSLSYNHFSSAEEASQQAEMAMSQAYEALVESMKNDTVSDEEISLTMSEQKYFSEVTLQVTRFESNICFQGEGGSLLLVCRNEREPVARRGAQKQKRLP